jgi:hypothetical protein
MRKFHSDPKLAAFAKQWDAATQAAGGFKNLPNHVGDSKKLAPQFVKSAGSRAQKGVKNATPKFIELAHRIVNHAMESSAEEKKESPAVVKSEGAKGEVAERQASGKFPSALAGATKGSSATAARMAHLRSMRGKK